MMIKRRWKYHTNKDQAVCWVKIFHISRHLKYCHIWISFHIRISAQPPTSRPTMSQPNVGFHGKRYRLMIMGLLTSSTSGSNNDHDYHHEPHDSHDHNQYHGNHHDHEDTQGWRDAWGELFFTCVVAASKAQILHQQYDGLYSFSRLSAWWPIWSGGWFPHSGSSQGWPRGSDQPQPHTVYEVRTMIAMKNIRGIL